MSTAEKLHLAAHVINYIIALPLLVLGIVGVILSVTIFISQHSFRRNTTINYLLAGSILAGIHFLLVDIQTLLVEGFNIGIYNTNETACREHTYFRYVTTVSAICFPCWAAFDQYVGTSHDATFRNRWRSMRFVRIAIVNTVLVWIIIYIPIIFTSEIIDGTCQLRQGPYTTFNTYVLTPLVHTLLPAIYGTDDLTKIGGIRKKYAGYISEAFTSADSFTLEVPMDLDAKMKAVALSALFLIVSHLSDFIEKFQLNLIVL
ncbi:unnamed protein product [Rotaria sp. Silwood2]|nr:unnamed protein product [Rotaria sp. Silwood2]